MSDKITTHIGHSAYGYLFKGDHHLSMSMLSAEGLKPDTKPVIVLADGETFAALFRIPGGDNLSLHTTDPEGLANALEDMAAAIRQAEFERWVRELEVSA